MYSNSCSEKAVWKIWRFDSTAQVESRGRTVSNKGVFVCNGREQELMEHIQGRELKWKPGGLKAETERMVQDQMAQSTAFILDLMRSNRIVVTWSMVFKEE